MSTFELEVFPPTIAVETPSPVAPAPNTITIAVPGPTGARGPGGVQPQILAETPSGTINGSTVAFTLAATPAAGSLRVYYNGQRLNGGHTLVGRVITFDDAPVSGDIITADYGA